MSAHVAVPEAAARVLASNVTTKAAGATISQAPAPMPNPRALSSAPTIATSAIRRAGNPNSPPASLRPTNNTPSAALSRYCCLSSAARMMAGQAERPQT